MSFSWLALTRIKKLAPGLDVVFLLDRQHSWLVAKEVTSEGWVAGPGIDFLRENPRVGRKLRGLGRRVHVWTVNTEEDLDLCVDLGVEAVITDRPAMAMGHLVGRQGTSG
jgi:glycerophosphoryl diester phosphodiesterase